MIKLISLDVDGTLLDGEGRLPPANQIALKEASDRGVHIVLNTGKPVSAVTHLAEMMDFKYPVIGVGGALVVKKEESGSWTVLERKALPEKSLGAFTSNLVDTVMTVVLITTWRTYIFYGDRDASYNASMQRWLSINSIEDYTVLGRDAFLSLEGIELPVLNLVIHSEKDGDGELERLYDLFSKIVRPDIMMNYSNVGTLNFAPARAGKKPAVEFLCRELGVERSEVMALGDYDNDLEVVNWAGVGAIMANAPSKVKAQAPMIAPSNEQCGVAQMIKKYVLQNDA